jgi:hypothetical protein
MSGSFVAVYAVIASVAVLLAGLTLCLPNERSGGRHATRDHALNL